MPATALLTKNQTFGYSVNDDRDFASRPAPAAAVFSFPRGSMAKRGRPRKDGPRLRNGRLRYISPVDQGHELTLAHRAATIGSADPRDPRAGSVIGRLCLRGDLADPELDPEAAREQNEARYRVALHYERITAIAWGFAGRPSPFTLSHMACLVAESGGSMSDLTDDDRATIIRRNKREANEATAAIAINGTRSRRVLDNIVRFQREPRFMDTSHRRTPAAWAADARDIAELRLALNELVYLWADDKRKSARIRAWVPEPIVE